MTIDCPICATPNNRPVAGTPYHECPTCYVWHQSPLPPKVYQAPTEYDLQEMPEGDRQVNRDLARRLFDTAMGGKPGRTLDIGCKHPVMAAELATFGCESYAIDGVRPEAMAGVDTYAADFESTAPTINLCALITMIHVFEHMYDPAAALRRLRRMVNEDGRVFLRLPDHRVPGFERDLTPHHFSIHPYFHTLTSILELLQQVGDCFEIESTYAFDGVGQRDIVLRPIARRPRLAVAMICKNEERDIPRVIKSFRGIADYFALVDTGSTDSTYTAATLAWGQDSRRFTEYLDASEKEGDDWKLWNFSEARNVALADAERASGGGWWNGGDADWVVWFDADDELMTPAALRRAMYFAQYDCFGIWIQDGPTRWIQQRMWKASKHIRFKGRCHEYPVLDGCAICNIDEGLIVHHSASAPGQENSNPRNERILLREWSEEPSSRTAFYLGNTYKDSGRHAQAAEWYEKRMGFGVGFQDEYLMAALSQSRCYRALKDWQRAALTLAKVAVDVPAAATWQELTMERAYLAYDRGQYATAIEAAQEAAGKPIPPTPLWREPNAYRDGPLRLISWCHEHLGNINMAVTFADAAAEQIGGPDEDWARRTHRLRAMAEAKDAPAPAVVKRLRQLIALHRPGAIGDILMTLNLIPLLREANPDADIHYFCSPNIGAPDALGGLMHQAGVDVIMDCANAQQWRGSYDRWIDLIGYPLAEGYPEKPMRRHLLEYFAVEMGLGVQMSDGATVYGKVIAPAGVTAMLPALTVPRPMVAESYVPYATMQMRAGWSAWKEWGDEKWEQVRGAIDFPIWLIDEHAGRTLSESIALFANARIHLGIDSFTNHLTHYYWQHEGGARKVPGVILWGSTQASAAGYDTNVNISKGLHCQPCFRENPAISRMPRGVCVNPPMLTILPPSGFTEVRYREYGDGLHQCMADISVDEVVTAARELWERTNG